MTNLTNALASRIANEDEIHFVHARNRVLLAIRYAEAFADLGYTAAEVVADRGIYDIPVSRATFGVLGRNTYPSPATIDLAVELMAA